MAAITSATFALASLQATIFTPEEELAPQKLQRVLLPALSERFDGPPFMLPLGGLPAPREVPKIILQDTKGAWRCEFASSRVNLFYRETTADSPPPSMEVFYVEAANIFEQYKRATDCRIGRLAAVVNRFTASESPGYSLAAHFCRDEWLSGALKRPENFELHSHKTYMLDNFHINSWMRAKTATLTRGESAERQQVVLIEQDINTLSEELESEDFSIADARAFFSKTSIEFDSIVELYFPR